jgi:sphingosine kinase
MLNESHSNHDVLITKRAGHAIERMMEKNGDALVAAEEKDIAEYDGIIAMGGDGILAEILEGLKKRRDYDSIVQKLTFGIVGCGTSNGLAASILHAAKVSNHTQEV